MRRLAFPFVLLPLALAGCHESYSPNTYASAAAQEEANVQRGVIIGVRQVMITTSGAVGAATGGAVGGVAGAQLASGAAGTAIGAIAGTLVGGIGGTAAAQAVTSTKAWEYIVEEPGNKLVSVTQTSQAPLPIGAHVLVIADTQQARIVRDYTVQTANAATAESPDTEIHINPSLPPPSPADPLDSPPLAATAAPPPAAPSAAAALPAAASSSAALSVPASSAASSSPAASPVAAAGGATAPAAGAAPAAASSATTP